MATVATFTTIHGRLIHQVKDGSAIKFISDTLGSVIAEYDVDGGGITYEAEYWPYGEVRAETGTSQTSFGFVGVLGYMKDFGDRLYVRARYLRTRLARWQTADPLWPTQLAYTYCDSTPSMCVDYSGLSCWPCKPCSDLITDVDFDKKDQDAIVKLLACLRKANSIEEARDCMGKFGLGLSDAAQEKALDYLACIAVQSMFDSLKGSRPPCDPCADMYVTKTCDACCYMKYLRCLMGCVRKHSGIISRIGYGKCIENCRTGVLAGCKAEVASGPPCV